MTNPFMLHAALFSPWQFSTVEERLSENFRMENVWEDVVPNNMEFTICSCMQLESGIDSRSDSGTDERCLGRGSLQKETNREDCSILFV